MTSITATVTLDTQATIVKLLSLMLTVSVVATLTDI